MSVRRGIGILGLLPFTTGLAGATRCLIRVWYFAGV